MVRCMGTTTISNWFGKLGSYRGLRPGVHAIHAPEGCALALCHGRTPFKRAPSFSRPSKIAMGSMAKSTPRARVATRTEQLPAVETPSSPKPLSEAPVSPPLRFLVRKDGGVPEAILLGGVDTKCDGVAVEAARLLPVAAVVWIFVVPAMPLITQPRWRAAAGAGAATAAELPDCPASRSCSCSLHFTKWVCARSLWPW